MSKQKTPKFKKVIFIVADTLRQINLEKKDSIKNFPNVNYLKKNGVDFKNAYATVTKTFPSIAAIMSGYYPLHLGLVNHANVDSEYLISKEEELNVKNNKFLPEILKENGYKTLAIDWLGLWFKRGFDYYSGPLGDFKPLEFRFEARPILFYLNSLKSLTVRIFRREIFTRAYFCFSKNPHYPYDTAEKVFDKAINLLNKNLEEKVFLYLHLWDTHEPHVNPKGFASYLLDTVDRTYEAEIKHIDTQMGRLIDYLKKTNQINDSIIIFTSDHGENFYESGSPFAHDLLYENVVKIPLFFSSPKIENQEVENLVNNLDIFPTLLRALNIKTPSGIDGISFDLNRKEILGGKNRSIYFEDILKKKRFNTLKKTRRRGIRVRNYKFIETIAGKKEELTKIMPSENLKIINRELYNLKADPKEKNNLVNKKPKLAKELEEKLHNLIQELNFKRLSTNPDLQKKVKKSLGVIRKAAKKYPADKIGIAWTGGKDSTVLLHLIRLAFNGKVPFRIIFNDSTMEFDEIYKFIEKMKRLWNLDVITIKHSKKELEEFKNTRDRDRQKELSRLMKITAINTVVKKYKLKALVAGIRWDEHESRSKETYFSKRKDHGRVHPILQFTEKDIWEYIEHFGVPYVSLYKKGYRSLGEKPFTKKATKGGGERSGRERDKEKLMENLRKLGYW